MPLKHLGEVLITSWLFRSWVCQIHPPETSQWQNQYSSWKVSLYFHFTYGMTKTLRQINTKTVQFICHNWNCWPLKDEGKTENFQSLAATYQGCETKTKHGESWWTVSSIQTVLYCSIYSLWCTCMYTSV